MTENGSANESAMVEIPKTIKPINLYKITCLVDGKVYIGQTVKTIRQRFREHRAPSSQARRMRTAMQEHGRDNFVIELVAIAESQSDADWGEKTLIEMHDSCNPAAGYNISSGGASGGYPHSEEWKIEHSKELTGKQRIYHVDGTYHYGTKEEAMQAPNQIEYKARNKAPLHSEESKRKISENQKGNKRGVRIYDADGSTHFGSKEEAAAAPNQEALYTQYVLNFREKYTDTMSLKSASTTTE